MARMLFFFLFLGGMSVSGSAQQTIIRYLSGTDKDNTVDWDFFVTGGRNSGEWSSIPVPSCWETKGFGSYHYGWEENFKSNESGLYRYNFLSDPSWKGKRVRIVFEGSMTDTEVRINGKLAGPVHRGSFYRFKYDITSLLRENNLLEVKVDKISADTSVNRAERMSDFWVFGGIYRPVYLEVLPSQFIDWIAVDARADGKFSVDVYPVNAGETMKIEAQLFTLDGKPLGDSFSSPVGKRREKVTLSASVSNPLPWTPESPHRYRLVVRLTNKNGVVHEIHEKFGFRTVEFREGDGLYVNGTKVIFKGVNRHSFWPESGRTTSRQLSITDVSLMKEMNMNAVRMSHYPPDVHFLDVCDSLGLFVLDELCGWQKKYDTPVGRQLVREMVIRDVNHPSIVIWDNGNEGGNNHELVQEYARYDPQKRIVIHPWNIFNGTDTQHYKGYDCCAGTLNHGGNVFFPTEFLHGLYDGGHGAGLEDHWKLMSQNPLFAGVFLWVFADEGIVREDQNGRIDVKGNAAPDGILGPHREKEGSFFTIRQIWSPVQFGPENLPAGFDGTLEIRNNYLYTRLSDVKIKWKLLKVVAPFSVSGETVLAEGSVSPPDLPPGRVGYITVPLKESSGAEILHLTAIGPDGREVSTWSWPLKNAASLNPLSSRGRSEAVTATEDVSSVILSSAGVSVAIDKKTGLISSVRNTKAAISLSNGPALANRPSEITEVKHYKENEGHVVEVMPRGDLRQLRYVMAPDGILKVEYAYFHNPRNAPGMFDYLGVTFNYPEEKVNGVTYLGAGPYRVWKNRMKGGTFGIHRKKYNNTVTGESWDYPEFKGYYRDFRWVIIENDESPFLVSTDSDNLFLRLYTPEKPKGAKNDNTSPPFPPGDISFLHGISAIGTKFDAPETHGPQSGKNRVGTEWIRANLYFDFRAH